MNRVCVRATGVVLAAGALASVATVVAGVGAEMAVHRVLAGRPDVSVASVSVNPWSGTLTLHGVAVTSGPRRVRIGALRLPLGSPFDIVSSAEAFPMGDSAKPVAPATPPSSAPPPPALAPNGTAAADNIVVSDGPTTYRIRHIELAGTPLSNADLMALLDPKSAEPAETRLRKFTASSVTVSEVTADSVVGASEQHWSQKQILLANVVGGKAALGSAGPATLAAKAEDNASNLEIGGMQLAGFDMAQMAHVFATSRTDDGEPLRPVFDSVTASGFKLTDVKTGNVVTIGSLKEENLKARAFKIDLRTQRAALAAAKPNDPASAAFLNDALTSTSIGLIEMDDVASVPQAGGEPGYPSFNLTKVAGHEIGNGRKVGGLELRNLRIEGPQGRVALASADMGTLSVPLPADTTSDKAQLPNLASAGFADLSFDMNVAGKDQPPQRVAFAVKTFSYAAPLAESGPIPPKGTATVDHVTFDVQPNDSSTEMFRSLGYKHVDLSSRIASSYAPAQQTLSLDKWVLDGIDMGSLQLKLTFTNVSDKIASPNPEVQRASAIAILFKDVDLVLRNDGLVERAIRHKAEVDGKTVDQERELLTSLVTQQIPALAGDSPKLQPLTGAIAKFIATPKTLHVSIASKNGLGAADAALLGDPTALLDQLEIKASANE